MGVRQKGLNTARGPSLNASLGRQQARLRRRAEQMAWAFESAEIHAHWPAEALRALQELRVHQIELEMQNEELRSVREQLEASRARYFDLYDLAPVGYLALSKEWLILEANLTAAGLLGVGRSALRRQRLSRFILTADQDIFYLMIRQLSITGRPQTCELRMTSQDAAPFWARLDATAGREEGVAPAWRAVISDITEHRRMEEQRAELLAKDRALASEKASREREAELARVVRALSVGELTTSIAHEVNQPLAGVVTNAEAALRWLSGEIPRIEETKESLALIARDANRASAVIRRIREFVKKGSRQTTLVDVNEVIQEAVELAQADLLRREIAIRLEISRGLPRIRGDRVELQQVVLNMVMNAAEAMASIDGPRHLIVLSKKSADGSIVVAIRDNGPGIQPSDLDRMFDAFFTTKPAGIGMGLAISRTIIEAHGGRIWAELNDGGGLTVQFGLPAETASQAPSIPS